MLPKALSNWILERSLRSWIQFWCEGYPSLEVLDLPVPKEFQCAIRTMYQQKTGDIVSSFHRGQAAKPLRPKSDRAAARGSRLSPQHSRALSWTLTKACFPHSAALLTTQCIRSVHQLSAAVTLTLQNKYYDLKTRTEQTPNYIAKACNSWAASTRNPSPQWAKGMLVNLSC